VDLLEEDVNARRDNYFLRNSIKSGAGYTILNSMISALGIIASIFSRIASILGVIASILGFIASLIGFIHKNGVQSVTKGFLSKSDIRQSPFLRRLPVSIGRSLGFFLLFWAKPY
jgi:hypothetical protein